MRGIEQPVEMDDDIFHFRIVDGPLRRCAPGLFRGSIIGEYPDEIDRVQILKIQGLRIAHAAAEYEM